jgi:glutamine synthetase
MRNDDLELNPNPVVAFLGKPSAEFTKADVLHFIEQNGIRMINFMYPAGDGRLKTLNFVIESLGHLNTILTLGERVDGSSLFPGIIDAQNSDLYAVPRFRTAFVDPLAELPTLTMLCSFFDKDGKPFESAPEYTLHKACAAFRHHTGMDFCAMGELEYYVLQPETDAFPATDQRGYHESTPFSKTMELRTECMAAIAATGGKIKYGHNEVGVFTEDGMLFEQNEIEFLPVPAEEAADQLVLAKWIIRGIAARKGMMVTFSPKITVGKAGSGLHIHTCMMRDGVNAMRSSEGTLSEEALRAIAGMMVLAPSITAFGNTNPTSYFRLVPHQEAPTNICWGDRNRSALVRVPLAWNAHADMCHAANPLEEEHDYDTRGKQTVEMRSPDGSANVYLLIAALCVAQRHGLEMTDALDIAHRTYVDVNIHLKGNESKQAAYEQLPDSCFASADALGRQRSVYEQYGVFAPSAIDGIMAHLKAFDDRTLRNDIAHNAKALSALVEQYFHCG